jgi:hypothetical protein
MVALLALALLLYAAPVLACERVPGRDGVRLCSVEQLDGLRADVLDAEQRAADAELAAELARADLRRCAADAARDAAHAAAETTRLRAHLASADARIVALESRPLPWGWVAVGVAVGVVVGAWVSR